MMSDMDMALNNMEMAIDILATTKMEDLMAKGYINGQMERPMMANGLKVSSMGQEYGRESKVKATLGNGGRAKHMDMVSTLGKMVNIFGYCDR